jgi:hypothetical protein
MNPLSIHSQWILLTSNISLISAIYGYNYNAYPTRLWLLPLCTYVNSVNYWRKPELGWRRNLDIFVTCSALVCQNIIVYNTIKHVYLYCVLITMTASMYPIGYFFYWRQWYKMSTLSHMLLHILGNLAHLSLYSQLLEKVDTK